MFWFQIRIQNIRKSCPFIYDDAKVLIKHVYQNVSQTTLCSLFKRTRRRSYLGHYNTEAVAQGVLYKRCSKKFSKSKPATLLIKRLWHRCFSANSAKLLRTPFLKKHLQWLLLIILISKEITYFQLNTYTLLRNHRRKPPEVCS